MDQGELSDSSQMKESGGLLIGSVLYLNSTGKPEPRWKQESANKKCPNGIGSWIKHQGTGIAKEKKGFVLFFQTAHYGALCFRLFVSNSATS